MLAVRDVLQGLELESFVKTSGSKGFHILVALEGQADFESSWRFGLGIGALLVQRFPQLFTQEFIKADRHGRILVDTGRNSRGATFAAAYAVRARPGAPVSAPCTWAEVQSATIGPQSVTLRTMPQRLAEIGDLWSEMSRHATSLAAPLSALQTQLSEAGWTEALAAATRRPVSRKRTKKP
jgi:bifunctional non-homologous end joining protein LigD